MPLCQSLKRCLSAGVLALATSAAGPAAAQDEFEMVDFAEVAETIDLGEQLLLDQVIAPVGFIERVDLIPGRDLNGRDLNRPLAGGAQLSAVQADPIFHPLFFSVPTMLDGSALRGYGDYSVPLEPNDYVGAVFQGFLNDASAVHLRIDGMFNHGQPVLDDVFLYEVGVRTSIDGGYEPLCGVEDDGTPIPAIALAGTWNLAEGVDGGGDHFDDEGLFTFACHGYVLAKCVEAGYHPWAEHEICDRDGCFIIPMAGHHQACTRMMRADYCGDGTPHTVDGTAINFYDDVGVRGDAAPWDLEAEWDEAGALCADTTRIARLAPACLPDLEVRGCGTFEDGALILSEVEPR